MKFETSKEKRNYQDLIDMTNGKTTASARVSVCGYGLKDSYAWPGLCFVGKQRLGVTHDWVCMHSVGDACSLCTQVVLGEMRYTGT